MTATEAMSPILEARPAPAQIPPARHDTNPKWPSPGEHFDSLPAAITSAKPKENPRRATSNGRPTAKTSPLGVSPARTTSAPTKRLTETKAATSAQTPSAPANPSAMTEKHTPEPTTTEAPMGRTKPTRPTESQLLATIRTLGALLDDLERVRIQNGNRVAAMEREHGSSLPHLDVIAKQVKVAEHLAELELVRAWRLHPLAPWCKSIPGVGEKTIARLIAEIGEPADRRNVAKLWAYCGLGDPTRKRRKGMTQADLFALGSPEAKKRCWLLGEAFVKVNRGPYRLAYDVAREKYADRVHAEPCVRCGPSGHPAPAGSPWSLKHQHEAAKRYAVKQFLKDLWVASRQRSHDAPRGHAGGDPE